MNHMKETSLYLIAIGLFLFIGASTPFNLPSLHYDEVNYVPLIFHWPSNLTPVEIFSIPLMIDAHNGALKLWLMSPVLHQFGLHPAVVRISSLFIAFLGIIIVTFAVRKRFGLWPAILSIFLLCIDTGLIHHARTDFGPTAISFLFRCITLYFFISYVTTGRQLHFYAIFFLLGLGIWDNCYFVFFGIALLAAVLYIRPYLLMATPKKIAYSLASFLLGLFPWILWNVQWKFLSIKSINFSLKYFLPSFIWKNFLMAVQTWRSFYPSPIYFPDKIGHFGYNCKANMLFEIFFVLAVIAIGIKIWKRPKKLFTDPLIPALLTLFLTHLALLIVFIPNLESRHAIGLAPLPQILVALMIWPICSAISHRANIQKTAVSMIIIPLFLGGIYSLVNYRSTILRMHGRTLFSTSMYALAHNLRDLPAKPIWVADWGISNQLQFLMPDCADYIQELFGNPDNKFSATLQIEKIRKIKSGDYLITHSGPENIIINSSDDIKTVLESALLVPYLLFTVEDQDKMPYLFVFRLEDSIRDTD